MGREDSYPLTLTVEEAKLAMRIRILRLRHKYQCHDCGHEFTAKHEGCPQKRRFGVNLLVYLT
ncbi:MAG: hypothetical protein OCU22_08285 [Canidatus Methanoxibalbensis ujae]|nr:hypothetical protein [Candidatus Methanoxibalbensis ujae]